MNDHWLARDATIRRLWALFLFALIVVFMADLVTEHHARFSLEATFGFGAWFGFASCVALIVLAKALGAVLRRPDTYYDD